MSCPRPAGGTSATVAVRSRPGSHSLQAPAASREEVAVAELLLGQVVPTADHLVVELPGRAPCRAEDIGALVAVLEAAGVIPAGADVRVGDRLHDLVARRADLDVGVGVS